jgi:phage shock protein A
MSFYDDKISTMNLADLKKERNKWQRKRMTARGRGEFFGLMIIDRYIEKIDKCRQLVSSHLLKHAHALEAEEDAILGLIEYVEKLEAKVERLKKTLKEITNYKASAIGSNKYFEDLTFKASKALEGE